MFIGLLKSKHSFYCLLVLLGGLYSNPIQAIVDFSDEDEFDILLENITNECSKDFLADIMAVKEAEFLQSLIQSICFSLDGDMEALQLISNLTINLDQSIDNLPLADQEVALGWYFMILPAVLDNLNGFDRSITILDFYINNADLLGEIAKKYKVDSFHSFSAYMMGAFIQRDGDHEIAVGFFNLAERLSLKNGEYSEGPFANMIPPLLRIKISKMASLFKVGSQEEVLSEIQLTNQLLKTNTQLLLTEDSWQVMTILQYFWSPSQTFADFQFVQEFHIQLIELLINNPNLEFTDKVRSSISMFLFLQGAQGNYNYCSLESFISLLNDPRVSIAIKEHIERSCYPSQDLFTRKYLEVVESLQDNEMVEKYKLIGAQFFEGTTPGDLTSDTELKDIIPRSLERAFFNFAFMANPTPTSINSSLYETSKQQDFEQLFYEQSLSLQSINIYNIQAFSVAVVNASLYWEDDEELEQLQNIFFEKKILIPSVEEVIDFIKLDQPFLTIEDIHSNFHVIASFDNLNSSLSHLILMNKDQLSKKQLDSYIEFTKSLRDFYMDLAKEFYWRFAKDQSYLGWKSQTFQDSLLALARYSLESNDSLEFLSGEYDFVSYPSFVLGFILLVDQNQISNSIKLNADIVNVDNAGVLNELKELKSIYIEKVKLSNFSILSKELTEQAISELRFLSDDVDIRLDKILDKIPMGLVTSHRENSFDLSFIQSRLKSHEAIHYFFRPHFLKSWENSYEFIISNGTILIRKTQLSSNNLIKDAYNEVTNFNSMGTTDNLDTLSKSIYGRYKTYLKGITKIIFVADGDMKFIPFHALKYQDQFLIENYEITYLPHIGSMQYLENDVTFTSFFGVGNPAIGEQSFELFSKRGFTDFKSLSSLAETEIEINDIAKYFAKSNVLLGKNATEEKLRLNKLNLKSSLIYFGTHSLPFSNNISDEPGLILTPPLYYETNENDGILTLSDIASINFEGSKIALSACKTFDSAYLNAEAYSGLASAFYLSGANSVYLTMWEIESFSAVIFNQVLFQEIYLNNKSFTAALQSTSKQFIDGKFGNQYSHPAFWAPYINLGL